MRRSQHVWMGILRSDSATHHAHSWQVIQIITHIDNIMRRDSVFLEVFFEVALFVATVEVTRQFQFFSARPDHGIRFGRQDEHRHVRRPQMI